MNTTDSGKAIEVAAKLIRKKFKRNKFTEEDLREDLGKLEALVQEAQYNQDQNGMDITSAEPAVPEGTANKSTEPETPDQRRAELVEPPPAPKIRKTAPATRISIVNPSGRDIEEFLAELGVTTDQLPSTSTIIQQRAPAPAIGQSTHDPIDRDSNIMKSRDTAANTGTPVETPLNTAAARPKPVTHFRQDSIKKHMTKGGNTTPQKNRIAEMDIRTRYGNHIHMALVEGDLAKADWWRERRANAEARERAKVLTVVP
jgi:hypothetical protein